MKLVFHGRARYEKKKIDVLVNEYQACHRNRNHYDSLVWTVGSIFVAASLTLLGLSLSLSEFQQVNAMAVFSFLLISIWYAHIHHINPYVLASIKRFHEIESELRKMGFDIRLARALSALR